MPSFDAVLEPNFVEIRNGVDNAAKEIGTRFDFKGTGASIELKGKEKDSTIELVGDSDFQLEQLETVIMDKMTKRKVELTYFDREAKVEKLGGDKVKKVWKVRAGIPSDLAKKIVGKIKDSKLKVQAGIQGDAVRVTGKDRDVLQTCIALLRKEISDTPLSFNNFRD
ncbi:YajQ family cyclic di-GMP-binding protein [Inhella gelatinilytica]|uniref:Nucleotide-binding protein I7X43_08020 n=1 Tax=Inhella gelatinilytica TaxID=2795030 RepID=A0A931NAS4_9BURK|nr:YajQ family cyclic di-GMP-binding protein [Inhella gelatinilytica]MBH9552798.1 YajQ family cyclic di-GMP-binding protein [Inhella gelatinilytica]